MTPLHALLPLRALAEQRVEAYLRALAQRGQAPPAETSVLVAVELDWICDLQDPDARAVIARLVGGRIGLDSTNGIVFTLDIGQVPKGKGWRTQLDWLLVDWNMIQRVVLEDSTFRDPAQALLPVALQWLA